MASPDVKSDVRVDNGTSERSFRDALASGGADEKAGTADDRVDMFRMGKTQELRVSKQRSLSHVAFPPIISTQDVSRVTGW